MIRNWLEIDIFLIKFIFFRFLDTNSETVYLHKNKKLTGWQCPQKKLAQQAVGPLLWKYQIDIGDKQIKNKYDRIIPNEDWFSDAPLGWKKFVITIISEIDSK